MSDKIYLIACSKELESMGIDRLRKHVEGMEETTVNLDWSRARLVPVVADERIHFEAGEVQIVSIRPIKLEPYSMVVPSFYGVNGMGHLLCIGSLTFRHFSEERVADKAQFRSHIRASVLKGDLLGQVLIVPGKRA